MAKKRKRTNKPKNQRKDEDPGFCSDEELVGGEERGEELSGHQKGEFTDPVSSFDEQGEPSGEQVEFSDEPSDEPSDDEPSSDGFFDEFFDDEF